MITTFAVIILLITGSLIPAIHIPSPLEKLQNQLSQLIIGSKISGNNLDYDSLMLSTANYMGNLPVLDLQDVNTFEQYHNFVDKVNDAIKILNREKLGMQIPLLQYTPDEYDKISKIITKFVPLINEYNDMILSAKNLHDAKNQNSINNFYIKTGVFSVMLLLVVTAAYAGPSYTLVGTLYRSSGLTTMAFKCPSCVSVVLSNAHWAVRGYFVEATANILDSVLITTSKLVSPRTT